MKITDLLNDVKTVAVFGHVRPDGDCLGSTLGLTNYLKENNPELSVKVYLEGFSSHFKMIPATEYVEKHFYTDEPVDLCILLDVSNPERIGAGGALCIKNAKKSVCFDHHIANSGDMCDINIVKPDYSSASEVIMDYLDMDKISRETAMCLYMGIAHDTGVFQFSLTSPATLRKVANLIEKDIPFSEIVQNTYYSRGYNQIKATGAVLQNAKLHLDGKVISGYLTYEDMKNFKVSSMDMDGIVDALREYEDCDVAIFMYPLRDHYKLSLRAKKLVDVNKVCGAFGGGGHVKAAGCQMQGNADELIEKVVEEIAKQL